MAVCEFCGRGDLDKATVGETRQLGDIVIHEYCVVSKWSRVRKAS